MVEKEIKKNTKPLRNGYIFFGVVVVVTLVAGQFIRHYNLNTSGEDSALINIAGRQRMYSQRIAKQVYNISKSIIGKTAIDQNEVDTLKVLIQKFKKAHAVLVNGDANLEIDSKRTEEVNILLTSIEPLLNNITNAAEKLLVPNPDSLEIIAANAIIEENNLKFLFEMEVVVNQLETESLKKQSKTKMLALSLVILALAAIVLGFIFIFMPTIRRLNKGSKLIQETTDRLFLATSTARIGIWEYNVLSDTLIWDETMYAMYNMPYQKGGEKNMIRKWMATIHSNDVKRIKNELYESLKSGTPINSEFRIVWKDGSEHYIQAKAVANFDAKGKVVTLTGTNLDLTDLRNTEKELSKANIELQALFDSGNHVSTISTDLDGVITFFSKGSETLLGYTAQEMVGKQTPAILHVEEEVIQRGNELTKQYGREISGFDVFVENAKNGEFDAREWTYKRKDGTAFPVQLVITGIRNSRDELTGYLGIGTDISWQKEKENELNTTINIVGEQNKRLLNFAYIVSHNLRSHTGNMEMILGILDTTDDEEEKVEMVQHLKNISLNLSETIMHLNEVVHIQTNLNIKKEDILLKKYVDETAKILSGVLKEKGGTIQNNIPDNFVVSFNIAYMESVLLNFLSNGLKYHHPDRAAVVKLDAYIEEGKPVLQISDNGLGINLKRHKEKLFGLYKTFHRNTDAKGVGLFITKNQIEAMGGSIAVESVVNQGTTFKIYFNK